MLTSMRSQVIILALLLNILRVKSQSISYVEAEDKTVGKDFALRTETFEHQIRANLDVNERRKGGKKASKGKKPCKPAKCSCAALKTKMESLEKGVDSILEKITNLQCTSTPPSDRKPVLVIGPVPWIIVSLEDFSIIPSNSTIPDPGLDFPFAHNGIYAVGKVINGIMYVCDSYKNTTYNKSCISYNGSGLQWKLEKEMKLEVPRSHPSETLSPGDHPKWIIQGGGDNFYPGRKYRDIVEVWTTESGKWKIDANYKSPEPNDLGCIALIEGKILQVGGRIYEGGALRTNRVFLGDVEVASLKSERIYHDCTIFENRVWVAGGLGYANANSKTVEIYDYKTDTWTSGPDFPPDDEVYNYGRLRVIKGDLYYICQLCEKIYKLKNNGGVYDWEAVADIPKHSGFIAEVMEIYH